MRLNIGDPAIVENLNLDQLKNYWQELKTSRYDSHYYLKLLEKIKALNPNLVMPPDEELETMRSEALNLALWEENWETKNRERVKNGGTDYSLFRSEEKIKDLFIEKDPQIAVNVLI